MSNIVYMVATDRPVADCPHPAGEGCRLAEDGGHVAGVPRHELRHAAPRAAEAAEVRAVRRVAVVDVAQLQRGAAAAAGHRRCCTERGSFRIKAGIHLQSFPSASVTRDYSVT